MMMCAHRSCADRAELYRPTGPGNSRQLQRWTTKEKPCCSTTKCTRPRATCISRRVCWPRPSTTILRFCRFHQNHNGYDNKAIRSCYGAILHRFISTIRRAVKSALFPIEPVWIYAFIASHIHGHIESSVWRHPYNRKHMTYRNAGRGGSSHSHMYIMHKNLVKIGSAVLEICSRTDRHAKNTQIRLSQYSASPLRRSNDCHRVTVIYCRIAYHNWRTVANFQFLVASQLKRASVKAINRITPDSTCSRVRVPTARHCYFRFAYRVTLSPALIWHFFVKCKPIIILS